MFTFITSRRVGKTLAAAAVSLLLAGGVAACGSDEEETITVSEFEDCDVEDQGKKEDDCGYWRKGEEVRMGGQPDMTWVWIWYTWVVLHQNSSPPASWNPPRGVTPPVRVVTIRKSKQNCAMAAFAPAPPPAPRPAPPKVNNPAPRVNNPAPRVNNTPRINKPPTNLRRGC